MKRFSLLFVIVTLLLSACTAPLLTPATEAPAPAVEAPATGIAITELSADDPLPTDPAIRMGTFDNGLSYYIRRNDEPMNRAELWLAVNAGSLLEEDDQQGLAHFLEHMLFNGTERFQGSGVIDFLEETGMEFGPDVNAYTSFDETVYTIQVPMDDVETVATALDVLEDWASAATLDPVEIDKERGVVIEEWRLRQETADGRVNEQALPFILGDSRYAERLPIGDMDIVRNAPPEAVRRYYDTWYRPDLMAVIAVGDFDVDEMEGLIQERFAALPAVEEPVERASFDLPSHEETHILVVTDLEKTVSIIQFIRKREAAPTVTVADFRQALVGELFYTMLNERFAEIAREPDAPFLFAGGGEGELVRTAAGDFIGAQVQDDDVSAGVAALVTEVERARRHGFTATELERAKDQFLRSFEVFYTERENIDNATFADYYLQNFLTGEEISSIEESYALVQELIPDITLEEVNQETADLVATDNRVILVTAPEQDDVTLPDEEELAAVVSAVEAQAIDPYDDRFVDAPLVADIPEPAEIMDERELAEIGVREIELANGVRVLMKPTDFKDDEVLVSAISPGGSSLVSDGDYPEADLIVNVVTESGAGDFDQTELTKLLSDKAVSVSPTIDELSEGFYGRAASDDLETLFQLIYLYTTVPRAEESALTVLQNQQRSFLTNRDADPNAALQDTLFEALYGETIRRGVLPLEEIEALDLARGVEIYRDRFADASDFTYTIVGAFDPDEATTLAQAYLGGLPATDRAEQWRDVAPLPPETVVEEEVYKGEGDRSIVRIVFSGPLEPTQSTKAELDVLADVLDIRLREQLREELGGVYSAGVNASVRRLPDPVYFMSISFGADPDRVEELVAATFAEIEALQNDGPAPGDVEKAIAQELSNLEEKLESNDFWLSLLDDYAFYGDEEAIDIEAVKESFDSLTADEIQDAARIYLDSDRYVKVVLYPEADASGN